jgi:hypothetical protein
VLNAGPDVDLDVPASATGATRVEDWVREKIIGKIPGSR